MTTPSLAQVTTTYTYDLQGQVRTVTRPANAITYGYDAAGNRTALAVSYPNAPKVSNATMAVPYNSPTALALPITGSFTSIGFPGGSPAHATLGLSGSTVTYYPTTGYIGPDSFTYNAVGTGGTSNTATVTVSVAAPAPPTVSNTSLTASYNGSGSVILPVGGLYTSIGFPGGSPAHGTLGLTGSTVTYYPTAGYYGADSFTYNATGPGGTSATATVSVSVAAPSAPSVSNTSLSSTYNGSGSVVLPVTGVYSSIGFPGGSPAHGVLGLTGSTVTYYPAANYYGADSFTYNATGPGGTSGTGTVSVTVAAPSASAPVANPDAADVYSHTNVLITPLDNDTDPQGYPLTITGYTISGGGSVTLVNGATQMNYLAPTVGTKANKTVTIVYTISNGHGGTASSTITVVVETEYWDH